jgi:uncharacterized protein (TIRG00374 family)
MAVIGERGQGLHASPGGNRGRGVGERHPLVPASPSTPDDGTPPLPGTEGEQTALITRTRLLLGFTVIVAVLIGLYLLIPKLAGLRQTWGQLRRGDPLLLAVGAMLELLSIAGYAALFRTVFGRGVPRIDWRVSLEIPLAGIAAIRLVAAAGAGGMAVTAWALGRAGMSAPMIACRMVASLVVQYSVYLGALIVCGLGLWTGLFAGGGSFALTVVPAAIGALLIAAILSLALMPRDVEYRLRRFAHRPGALGRIATTLAKAPDALGSGVRTAIDLARQRRIGLSGAVAYWGFDIAVLGVCFHAFHSSVAPAVLVVGYFLGTLGSLLPIPGGIGGVEGGMIAAFVAFGVPAGSAVIGVLAYRAISFWLPTLPGIVGYLALRSTVSRWRETDRPKVSSHHA